MQRYCIGFLLFMIRLESEAILECLHPISFKQEALVPRPKGLVVLTCEITNVIGSDVEFYWWQISERNEPIYTYSKKHKVDEVSRKHQIIFVNETRWSLDGLFGTKITLHTNVTDYNTYKCEFQLRKDQICEKSEKVRFRAASVFVTYRKLTKYTSNDFEDPTFTAMCSIDGAAGEPKFEIRFNGNEQHRFRVFLENSVIERKHYYHDGAYRATVKSPPQGQLICQVNDTRGSYKSSVDIADILHVHTPNYGSMSPAAISAITVAIVLSGALTVNVCRIWKRKKNIGARSAKQVQEGFPLCQGQKESIINNVMGKLQWTTIQEITNDPVIFANDGPSVKDIQQTVGAAADSWFLAALYSLLSSEKTQARQYIKDIFEDVTDLTAPTIPIRLWRYGKWETLNVEPTLPTKNGRLCFLHSEDKDVLWSALLQKAYYMNYISVSELEFERCRQLLQTLSGGQVISSSNKKVQWYYPERPVVTCQRKEGDYVHYCVISVSSNEHSIDFIRLREFPDISMKTGSSISSFPDELIYSRISENEFRVTNEIFQRTFSHFCELNPFDVCIYAFDGRWERETTDDVKDGQFWANSQFLVETDELIRIDVAVMQKPRHDKNDSQLLPPLQIGYKCFEIINTNFHPKFSLTKINESIKYDGETHSVVTHERVGSLWIDSTVRYIIVPFADGNMFPVEFLLRVFVPEYEIDRIRVRRLPPAPTEEVVGDVQEEETPLLSASVENHGNVQGGDIPLQTISASGDAVEDSNSGSEL